MPALTWERIELRDFDVRSIGEPVEFRGSLVAFTLTSRGREVVITSLDGRAWHASTPRGLTKGAVGRFVASDREILAIGGTRSRTTGRHTNLVWISRNGIDWTRQKTTGLGPHVGDVVHGAWTPHGWVLVAQTSLHNDLATNVLVSRDGRSWNLLPGMPWRGRPVSVTSGPHGTFVLLGVDDGGYGRKGRMEIRGTRDLERWNVHAIHKGQPALLDIADGPSAVVAMGLESWRSPDGVKWTRAEHVHSPPFFMRGDIAALPDGFVTVGHTTDDVAHEAGAWASLDGRRWTRVPGWAGSLTEHAISAVTFGDGVFAWAQGHRDDYTGFPIVIIGSRPR